MSASRVRVRLPHSHAGLIALSAWVGFIAALPLAVAILGLEWLVDYLSDEVVFSYAVIALLLFTALIGSHCQHLRWAGCCGAVYGASFVAVIYTAGMLHGPFFLAFDELQAFLFLPVPVGAVFGLAAALMTVRIYQLFIFRIIEQDGSLCISCGYPAQRSDSANCPECGTPTNALTTRSRIARLIEVFGIHRRAAFGIYLAILGSAIAWSVLSGFDDLRMGGRSWEGQWERTQWTTSAPREFGPATCAYQPFSENSDMYLAVDLAHRSAWQSRQMRIRIAAKQSLAATGRPRMYEVVNGDPAIQCTVPPEHIATVLRNGPPAELISRLLRAAEEADWKPADQWFMVSEIIEVPWVAE